MLLSSEKNPFLNLLNLDALHLELNSIYHDLTKLGYLDQFGNCCVVMAGMLAHILTTAGHRVQIYSCYAQLDHLEQRFLLGYQELVLPGQIDGHAICVIDGRILVDFGLGNARKYFSQAVPRAIACEMDANSQQLAKVELGPELNISWRTDWNSPAVGQELNRLLPHLPQLLSKYYANLAQTRASSASKSQAA